MDEITLIYSEDLLKKAVRSFWWRSVGPLFVLVLLAMLAGTIYFVLKGERSWLVGAMGSVVLMGFLFSSVLYINHYRNTLGKFRELKGSNSTFKMNPDCFELESIIGTSTMNWSSVTELWQFKDYWLIFLSKAQFFTLPSSCLTDSNRESIIDYIKAAGGKIA